jgi:hypothetical protein
MRTILIIEQWEDEASSLFNIFEKIGEREFSFLTMDLPRL